MTDSVIWRHNLQELMQVSSKTVKRWIDSGKLPKPDVAMSSKTLGWRISTLRNHGINL